MDPVVIEPVIEEPAQNDVPAAVQPVGPLTISVRTRVHFVPHTERVGDDTNTATPSDSMIEKAVTKTLLMANATESQSYDEILAIVDGVDWRTVSKNLDRYCIKAAVQLTTGPVPIGPHSMVCVIIIIGSNQLSTDSKLVSLSHR